jgi:hypothetical protein
MIENKIPALFSSNREPDIIDTNNHQDLLGKEQQQQQQLLLLLLFGD